MGLLDEAIRDHLELKRRRGADPTEVAREEHEALEPVFPDEPRLEEVAAIAEPGEFDDVDYAPTPADPSQAVAAPPLQDAPPEDAAPPESLPPQSQALGEETAELDMQAFLDADARGEHGSDLPEQIPGQERLTFE